MVGLPFIKDYLLSRHREALVTPNEPVQQRRTQDKSEDRSRIIHVVPSDWQVRRKR